MRATVSLPSRNLGSDWRLVPGKGEVLGTQYSFQRLQDLFPQFHTTPPDEPLSESVTALCTAQVAFGVVLDDLLSQVV